MPTQRVARYAMLFEGKTRGSLSEGIQGRDPDNFPL